MPYVSHVQNENGELGLNNGIFVDVFKELSQRLNFSYTVTKPPDGEWGVLQSDGSWSGMVGQLETKEVDLAVADFTITEERSKAITFSTLLDEIYHAIIIQNPVNAYHYEAYTSALTNETWLMILAWIVATPPILFIASRCNMSVSSILFFHYTLKSSNDNAANGALRLHLRIVQMTIFLILSHLMLLISGMGSVMKTSMSSP